MSEYGNLSSSFYLTLAYAVSCAVLTVYGFVIARRRLSAIKALKDEGFLDDKRS